MHPDRRTVLKTLLSLGISEILPIERILRPNSWANAYQALAAPNNRKLALLVGVNHYGEGGDLLGCLTDVELQKDLLLYRFGFKSEDILTLTGDKATREAIETAFLEHLARQAKAGDVVLFHYSGYGSQVKVSNDLSTSGFSLVNGLLPSDGLLPSKGTKILNYILLDTLFLLGRLLNTDKFTCILDTCYTLPDKSKPYYFPIRGSGLISEGLNREELAFQDAILSKIKNSSVKHLNEATYLLATQDQGIAVELILDHLKAGLFTYLLTQTLWETASPNRLLFTLSEVEKDLNKIMGEKQRLPTEKIPKSALLSYYSLPEVMIGAEGVITEIIQNNWLKIDLNGLPYEVLNYYGVNSQLEVMIDQNHPLSLQLRSRNGRIAIAELINKEQENFLEIGQCLQEKIRVFPKEIGLSVALDSKLERIERVDATSALATLKTVAPLSNLGEEWADCILGKTEKGGYGLFSQGGILLPKTEGKSNEAIKSAIERLEPIFKAQLAWKLLQLTQNEGSSSLGVRVTLEKIDTPSLVISQRRPQRAQLGGASKSNNPVYPHLTPNIKQGSPLQYRIENYSDRPINVLLIVNNSSDSMLLGLYDKEPILSGENRLISTQLNNSLITTIGIQKISVICCPFPLNQVQKTFINPESLSSLQILTSPLKTAQALLEDLQIARQSEDHLASDDYVLKVKNWATLNFIYQVV